jgi:hypothetical protein
MRFEEILKNNGAESGRELEEKVIIHLNETIEKTRIYDKAISWVLGCISVLAIIPVAVNLYNSIQTSGFFEYLKVFLSDPITMTFSRPEISAALAESLPVLPVTFFLMVIMAIFGAVRFGGDAIQLGKINRLNV